MGKKPKVEEVVEGAPAWMATFSDLMSLLLCFFVLIVSFSTMEKVKFSTAAGSLRKALTMLGSTGVPRSKLKEITEAPHSAAVSQFYRFVTQGMVSQKLSLKVKRKQEKNKNINKVKQDLQMVISEMGQKNALEIIRTVKGVRIFIPSRALFDSGSDRLRAEAHDVLSRIAFILKKLPYTYFIEGHTDDRATSGAGGFESNWELSTARAIAVVKAFISYDINPKQLVASGYGEYHPRADNATVMGRAKNRRVEINIDVSLLNTPEEEDEDNISLEKYNNI